MSDAGIDLGAAAFITGGESDTVPLLKGRLPLPLSHGKVVRASLTWTALGIVDARVDGRRVDGQFLVPGWTSYDRRLRVASADLPLPDGEEMVVTLQLAPGWYAGRLGWRGQSAVYGDTPAAAARLVVTFADGSVHELVTDERWQAGPSTVVSADLYDGQVVDLRRAAVSTRATRLIPTPNVDFVPLAGAVRAVDTLAPVEIRRLDERRLLIDFGQNLTGWVRLRMRGERGTELRLRHAEVLEDGELSRRPLRSARAEDTVVLSGGDDTFEPSLTVHGFRYVEVAGWQGTVDELRDTARAAVLSSATTQRGRFSCSDPLLTRLHENVIWSTRGNFLTLPTDCPQRDERLGWTGDIAVFADTALFLFDVDELLRDWLRDLAVEQERGAGRVPYVVPDLLRHDPDHGGLPVADTAIWGDAAVWLPWALWRHSGNLSVLRECFPSMRAHSERIVGALSPRGVWEDGFQFGDWLDPAAPPDDPFRARADDGVVATACAYRTFDLVARSAALLGSADEAETYRARADQVRRAFHDVYVGEDGRIHSDCETVYVLSLAFKVVDGAMRTAAAARLAQLVRDREHRIATGFAGTPFVLDALVDSGYAAEALTLLRQTASPSWLHPVTLGATTVWERWDSMLSDGSVNPGEMTSFNHYALGAVAGFLHRRVGGLSPRTAGFTEVDIAPLIAHDHLTWAETSLETERGRISVRWELDGDAITLIVVLPAGTQGFVRLPGLSQEMSPGRHVIHHVLTDATIDR